LPGKSKPVPDVFHPGRQVPDRSSDFRRFHSHDPLTLFVPWGRYTSIEVIVQLDRHTTIVPKPILHQACVL